jgi:hypothetical protein
VRATTDLDGLGLDEGGHLLVQRALAALRPGDRLTVTGRHPALRVHLTAWCREQGHRLADADADTDAGATGNAGPLEIAKGAAGEQRWQDARRAGTADGPPDTSADPRWGLAARGALVEAGGPPIGAEWTDREHLWADIAPQLYAAAAASQWDPATAVDWTAPVSVPPEIERAVVQLMTYLVENEQAALIIPARLLSQLHPHFREVMQLLATQAADEARHVEVFTRRGLLSGGPLGTSSAGGRASLQTLLAEPDFTTASFLLSVLGEGTFLDLLRFLHRHAPDPVTADVARLAVRDEARHVAFGVAHRAPGPHRLVLPAGAAPVGGAAARRAARHRWPEHRGLRLPGAARRGLVGAGRHQPRLAGGAGSPGHHGRRPPPAARVHRLPRRRGGGAVRPAHP